MIGTQIRRDLQARRAAAEIRLRREATENLAIKCWGICEGECDWPEKEKLLVPCSLREVPLQVFVFHLRNCILFLKWLAKEDPPSPFTGWVVRSNHQRWLVPGAVSPTKATV